MSIATTTPPSTSPREAAAAPPEKARVRRRLLPAGRPAGRDRGAGRRPGLGGLRDGGRLHRAAESRRRAASLRLERLLQRAVPGGAAPARRAPIPRRARPALLADLHTGHQGGPAAPRRWSRCSSRRSWASGPATPARTPCTAALAACHVLPRRRDGEEGPGGIALLDHDTFEVTGVVGRDRGDQYLAYDVWWHLTHDVAVTSEWGTPSMIEDGIVPELLLGRKYGHRLHFWDLGKGKHVQTVDLGDQYQMTLELRPAHDPTKKYGFVGVVVSVEDLSASIWLWHAGRRRHVGRDQGDHIPAEPADPPSCCRPRSAVRRGAAAGHRHRPVGGRPAALRSCWGTGELKQYDVSDPFHPREDRFGADRRHRRPGRAPGPAGPAAAPAARRWSR